MKPNILNIYGIGKIPFGASAASLLGLATYFFCLWLIPNYLIWLCCFYTLVLFWSLVESYRLKEITSSDPKEVVIDEFLGMLTCLIIANHPTIFFNFCLLVIFRILDIYKIPPFSNIDKIKTWYSLLLDDIAIGVFIGGIAIVAKTHL